MEAFFSKDLDFRVRLFNVLAMAGTVISFLMSILGIFTDAGPLNISANIFTAALSFALLAYSQKSGNYSLCYIITIVAIFIVLFPILFFTAGGYHSGMPAFFVFAVVFTVFMLGGKTAIILSMVETAIYIAICLMAYYRPFLVNPLDSEQAVLADIIVGFVAVSAALGICMFIHFRLYDEQQKLLSAQNRQLAEVNKMKTEFFASVSHEMKTPLTVISVHIQRAEALMKLGREGDSEKIYESFALVQDEIMRMSRLVNSSLKLSSMQEFGGQNGLLDISRLLGNIGEAYRTLVEKRGNSLVLNLPENLPPIHGSADSMINLLSNLLSNASSHTINGEITIAAQSDGDTVVITVADNGFGIEPSLLNRVFERGVSGDGGSGLGLAIAKDIANAHGGEISIESEENKGTLVTVTLPAYKGGEANAQR